MQPDIAKKIEAFFADYRLRKYAKGQVLMLNGDTPDDVFYLVEGQVKVYDVTYKGDEIILNVFKPPAFFPMSLAIHKGENSYIYEAETDVQLRQAPADKVVAFVKENPDVMFDLLSRVYRGTDGLLGRMAHLMASSAKRRLMYELLVSARRFGKQATDDSCTVPFNEKEIGARAGLTRETVSREMAKLKKENLVTVRAKDTVIHNLAVLEKKLDEEA